MKKILIVLAVFACFVTTSFGQTGRIPQRNELVQVENEEQDLTLEVFNMPDDGGQSHYFLSVGHLGIGDDIIQFNIDPLSELFIRIGDTLSEAMDKLKEMQELYKGSPESSIEVEGSLAIAFPKDNYEPVKVTYHKMLLSRVLEFSVERDGYIRATHIPRTDFGSVVTSLKLYQKMHPKEK